MRDQPDGTSNHIENTALEERLLEMIALNGPISVADYMADASVTPMTAIT